MFEVIAAAFVVMLASLSGVVFTAKSASRFLEEKLSYLISFSAGVFLVTAGALALEVFELASSLWVGALLIVVGYILAAAMHRLMPETHHHHDADCHQGHGIAARKIIIGDAIHNVADGVIIVAAFVASPALGVAATVSIIIHEVLQEISEFFVLRRAGYSVRKALTINFAVSSTILIGVGLGYFALASHELEVILLAVSAGFFMHVVLHDLLPKHDEHETTKSFLHHIAVVAVGAVLMGLIAHAIADSHVHGGDGHGHHDEHDHEDEYHDEHEHEYEHDHDHDHDDHDEHEDEHHDEV
jgi:zinc and cadmium transporter